VSAAGIDIPQMTQQSYSALQAGDCDRAKNGFEKIIATGNADTVHWLGLAYACSRLGDNTASLTAVDKSLELEPRNLRAVLLKAELLTKQGQTGAALQHYQYALNLAGNSSDLPADIRQNLVTAKIPAAEFDVATLFSPSLP
jgi:Tfp pilus assembly protein PilF